MQSQCMLKVSLSQCMPKVSLGHAASASASASRASACGPQADGFTCPSAIRACLL
jgi:hypothetical protein